MPTKTTTDQARSLLAKVRGVERNYRLGRYQGRNAHSTEQTRAANETAAWDLVLVLSRRLAGLVTEEHRTASRLSENRDAGVERPELVERLRDLRRELRAEAVR